MQNSVQALPDEHISSIVERFYVANGFENFDDFFMSLGYQRRRIKFFYDLYPQIKLYELLGIKDYSDFFLKHTEYPFVAPFLPPYRQIKYLSGPFGLVGFDTPNFKFEGLRKCPICDKEDGYTKRSHNLPGVVCCYKHKIPLIIDDVPVKEMINDEDVKYAIYAKEFADNCYDIDLKTLNKFLNLKSYNFIDYKEGLTTLMKLYPNLDDFKPVPNKIDANIDETQFIIHSVKNNLVDLTCKKCNTRFCTTVYGYKNGFRCPTCQSKLNEEELFNEHLSIDNEYSLISPYKSKRELIELEHLKCGNKFKTTPLAFYEGRKCPCNYKWTLSELTKEIEKDNKFELLEYLSKEEKIKVRHLDCGNVFIVGILTFIEKRRCKYCDSLTEEKANQIIENMGFKPISKYTSFYSPITCKCQNGHIFTKQYSNLTQRPYCPECKNNKSIDNTKHQALYRQLIKDYKQDDLIFIKDLNKEFKGIKTALATLIERKQLFRITDGVYSLSNINLSIEEQIIKTYIEGKDIIGYPTKTYFLKTLGLRWNDAIHICTNKTNKEKEVYCRGKVFRIYPLPPDYNLNKHNEHMIISFIKYGLYNNDISVIKDAMYQYIKANNLDLGYIRKHQNRSSKYAL